MAIIADIKEPHPSENESRSETAIDIAPPDYEEESQLHPATLPPISKSTAHLDLVWWRRWLRSPIAISLVFLGVAVIATGIGLAIHFTQQKHGAPPTYNGYPSPENGPNDRGGPWLYSNQSFKFPTNTPKIQFVSSEAFIDGTTSVEVAPWDQSFIGVDVNMAWRQFALTADPSVSVADDSSVSISCKYSGNGSSSLAGMVLANVTLRFPPNYTRGNLSLSSAALPPHCWDMVIKNMTAAAISFDHVHLEANSGNIAVASLSASTFNATTALGSIVGQTDVRGAFTAKATFGSAIIVNTHVNSTKHSSPRI